jgi:hypothetical protein
MIMGQRQCVLVIVIHIDLLNSSAFTNDHLQLLELTATDDPYRHRHSDALRPHAHEQVVVLAYWRPLESYQRIPKQQSTLLARAPWLDGDQQ